MQPSSSGGTERLILPSALFRFEVPCYPLQNTEALKEQGELSAKFLLPNLQQLDGKRSFADVRLGWCSRGLAMSVSVKGKQQHPWCHASRLEDSDGVLFWLSTRETDSIHRANRFCHQFVALPGGKGTRLDQPLIEQLAIQRAVEHPKSLPQGALQVFCKRSKTGYLLRVNIPAVALTGFDPTEFPKLAFAYMVTDRDFGAQTLTLDREYPIGSDPSLWVTLALQPNE